MFGERLKEIRLKNGLKQSVLAKYVGTTQTIISMYESGRIQPTLYTLERICKFFNVSSSELLGF